MNWGIIGMGYMAKKFANSFSSFNNTKLLAIASKSLFKSHYIPQVLFQDTDNFSLIFNKFNIEFSNCFSDFFFECFYLEKFSDANYNESYFNFVNNTGEVIKLVKFKLVKKPIDATFL